MENPRIIHGIISVSNKFEMKRNQVYNNNYENMLRELERRAKQTSIPLEQLVKEEDPSKQPSEHNQGSYETENNQKEDEKHVEASSEQIGEQISNET
jgi:hypothetical protein